jgi:hypothetical protein
MIKSNTIPTDTVSNKSICENSEKFNVIRGICTGGRSTTVRTGYIILDAKKNDALETLKNKK